MSELQYGSHYSVMKKDILDLFEEHALNNGEQKTYADLTFGAGGHSCAILEKFEHSYLHAFDQDKDALANGLERLSSLNYEERATIHHSNFENFSEVIPEETLFDGVLLDAGVSSHQFDSGGRGFSFRFDAHLDMRMNNDESIKPASYYINSLEGEELLKIFREYGEEKFSKNIVKTILERRSIAEIKTTKELEDICFHSYPKKLRHGKIHPATKSFQALRIHVNRELDVLTNVIDQVIPRLKIGGTFAVISFHSLEDRIVKHGFKKLLDGDLPVQILTKKPILPSEEEIFENSRSRSAKLRVVKRLEEWPRKNKYR
jgi:16S rRNA (cytosine1402-N4)-methyltransferase